jgi:SAM-dependent methyltransferase
MDRVLERLHPETRAGGFCYNNERLVFYVRLHALLKPKSHVLDFGAGRGKWIEREAGSFVGGFTFLKGQCERLVGFDVDDAVLQNPAVDEPAFASVGAPLPFPDASFDVIVSWATFEHISDADFYARELDRVLKPGGWICAWTPNKWGFVGIAARFIPNSFHVFLLRIFDPRRKEQDAFPTRYKLNTRKAISRYFPQYMNCSYIFSGHPSYHGGSVFLARLIRYYNCLVPECMGQNLHIFIRKPETLPSNTGSS